MLWTPTTDAERLLLARCARAERWRTVLRRDPCAYCNTVDAPRTFDHVLAWARGGDNGWHNSTAACGACQQRKADRSLLMLYAVRAGLRFRGQHRQPPPLRATIAELLEAR